MPKNDGCRFYKNAFKILTNCRCMCSTSSYRGRSRSQAQVMESGLQSRHVWLHARFAGRAPAVQARYSENCRVLHVSSILVEFFVFFFFWGVVGSLSLFAPRLVVHSFHVIFNRRERLFSPSLPVFSTFFSLPHLNTNLSVERRVWLGPWRSTGE